MKKLQTRIALYRRMKGISRRELGRCLDCSYPALMKYESGDRMPLREIVLKLLELLDCGFDDLFFFRNIHT